MIFGVTGDLARKKLMPAIYDLANRGLLPPTFALVGFRPERLGRRGFRQGGLRGGQTALPHPVPRGGLGPARRGISGSCRAHSTTTQAFARLAETLDKLDAERGTGGNHAFYLAIPPKRFPIVCEQLSKSGWPASRRAAGAGW